MNNWFWLLWATASTLAAMLSFGLGSVVERHIEVSSLRSTALEMSLSGGEDAHRSALTLKTWADALAAKL